MKKYILVLLMIVSPLMGQDKISAETNIHKNQWINYNIKRRGYQSFEESKYNSYGILSVGIPMNIIVPYSSNNISQIDVELTYLEHFKNKFYYTINVSPTFIWNDVFLFMYGGSIGFGGTFFDSRNEIGKGWLVGIDWESGLQVGHAKKNQDNQFNYFTGINIRGMYRTDSRLGISVAFQVLYHYYPKDKELLIPDRHELSIGPKIGLAF